MTKPARQTRAQRAADRAAYRQRHEVAICAWIAAGKTLNDYCRQPGTPAVPTVRLWREADAEFAAAYAQARLDGADVIAADCLRIADESEADTIVGDDGVERPNSEWIARSRLRVETRLKLLAKWFPTRYGDSLAVTGAGGEPLLPARQPNAIEAAAAIAGILAAAAARQLALPVEAEPIALLPAPEAD